jgi:hypothetical protein
MIPIIADVSFGIFAFMPLGWAFMAAIILIEIVVMSRSMTGQWWEKRIAIAATVANLVSGAIGICLSLLLNGGWWLVVWIPWVSRHEVAVPRQFAILTIYYVVAFVLSVIIEGPIEQLILKRRFGTRGIWKNCFRANVASYLFGSLAMYSWSFGILK